ncbi:hypothetical protein SCUP234_04018 [Seiridium cupressi]
MRSSLPISLVSLLLPALAASASTAQCLKSRATELAVESLCGDKRHLLRCFQKAPEDALQDTIEECLVNAGCAHKAAVSEASYLITFCNGEPVELKRRERDALAARDTTAASVASADSTTTTEAATTTTTTGTSAVSKRTTADTTATSTTAATTTATTGTTAATTAGATISGTDCSSASVTTVSSCDATNQYDCSMVETTTSVCKSDLFCTEDTSGNNLCMTRQDGMTLSGTIVAVFLAIVVTAIVASIVFLCCRDRKEQKRMRARAEAAAIAKSNSVSRPETRSISQPTRSPTSGSAQPNPFAG